MYLGIEDHSVASEFGNTVKKASRKATEAVAKEVMLQIKDAFQMKVNVSKRRKIEEQKYDDIGGKKLSITKTSNKNRTKESRKQNAIEKTKSINHNTFGSGEESEQENMEYNDLGDNDSMDRSDRTVWRDASDFGPNPDGEDYKKQIDITNSDNDSSTDRGTKQNRGFNCDGRKIKKLSQLKFVSDDDESNDGVRKSDAVDWEISSRGIRSKKKYR